MCCHPHHRVFQVPADRSAGEPGKELRVEGTKPSKKDKETAGEGEIKSSGVEFLALDSRQINLFVEVHLCECNSSTAHKRLSE